MSRTSCHLRRAKRQIHLAVMLVVSLTTLTGDALAQLLCDDKLYKLQVFCNILDTSNTPISGIEVMLTINGTCGPDIRYEYTDPEGSAWINNLPFTPCPSGDTWVVEPQSTAWTFSPPNYVIERTCRNHLLHFVAEPANLSLSSITFEDNWWRLLGINSVVDRYRIRAGLATWPNYKNSSYSPAPLHLPVRLRSIQYSEF